MKKVLFWVLLTLCIAIPSGATAASKPRMDVIPIQIITEISNGTDSAKGLEDEFIKQFMGLSRYRLTSTNEARLQLRLVFIRYRPRAFSFKGGGAGAQLVNMVSMVWTAISKNKHPFYIYHTCAVYEDYSSMAHNIIEITDGVVDMIYKETPYVFN